ncbi:MAG TPA: HD domain-containing phosphohydrolase [Xanthomonadales bacterium]|nr:HD domain-containing phosphohydrolase [Xanthomonadales bacterium]
MTVPVVPDGALGLYSAVGDAFAGRRLGFGRRRAALAARFAAHRRGDDATVASAWVAGALAETGLVDVVLTPDASPHARLFALADAPLHGARIVASHPGLPLGAADIVRWHREHDDGTGIPDRLRWDGIPAEAAALGIVHAFLEAIEDSEEPRGPDEALFTLMADSGRRFRIELVRTFREFVAANPTSWDEPVHVTVAELDEDPALAALAARIDARDPRSPGRSERLAGLAGALAGRLDLDPSRAGRLARLLALGRAADLIAHDDFDPLSRLARERRDAVARRAAAIAGSVPRYEPDAPYLAASAAWYEEGDANRLAAVLGLALAVDGLDPLDVPRRLPAAAGTQFDPDVTRVYLATLGAPT